jgi:hypothetical protein
VVREVTEYAHPDVPGVWVQGVYRKFCHPLDVDYEHIERVMAIAPDLVEEDAPGDPADPYVLALALQLSVTHTDVRVVTSDRRDRLPLKISMVTACARFHIEVSLTEEFLEEVGMVDDGEDERFAREWRRAMWAASPRRGKGCRSWNWSQPSHDVPVLTSGERRAA